MITKLQASVTNSSPPTSKRELVIGSSVVKNIDPGKLVETDVISLSGGRIRDVHNKFKGTDTTTTALL